MSKRDDLASGRTNSVTWGNSDLKVTKEQWDAIFECYAAAEAVSDSLLRVTGSLESDS